MRNKKVWRLLLVVLSVSMLVAGTAYVAFATTLPDCTGPKVAPLAVPGNPADPVAPDDGDAAKVEGPFDGIGVLNPEVDGRIYTVYYEVYDGGRKLKFWTAGDYRIVAQVIVKGGPNANIYNYNPAVFNDCNLESPRHKKNIPAISWIGFIFVPPPEEPDGPTHFQTAWADGPRYVTPGNWATYTPYEEDATVTIYAGQTINVGTVHFSAVSDGNVTLTITLTGGWQFENVAENLKIQDYATAPSGNPSIGLFAHKSTESGASATVTVPANNFYGIHLDVCR